MTPHALLATQYAPASGGGPGGPPPATASDLTDAVPALGSPATTAVVRQINLYPYPELPAYNGYGNVDAASSYYGNASEALQQPVQWLGKFDSTTTWCNDQGTDCQTSYGSW